MEKEVEFLNDILGLSENLYGVPLQVVKACAAQEGLNWSTVKKAKKQIGAKTIIIPASEDGVREERIYWMRR